MPLSQQDIQEHYEKAWRPSTGSDAARVLDYGDAAANAVMLPIFEQALRDLNLKVDGGRVLDVGMGAGRWSRFILQKFKPASLLGVDYTQAAVDLMTQWAAQQEFADRDVRFEVHDITSPQCTLPERAFDLVVIANVLFHVPEADKFGNALKNLAAVVADGGRIAVTDYLPRTSMRTQWMLVRSRYEWERALAAVGLRIIDMRPIAFFTNDPMGVDGTDAGPRRGFMLIRDRFQQLAKLSADENFRRNVAAFAAELDQCLLDYCSERLAPIDFPSQKLITLARA